jgi:hypothetical protein
MSMKDDTGLERAKGVDGIVTGESERREKDKKAVSSKRLITAVHIHRSCSNRLSSA